MVWTVGLKTKMARDFDAPLHYLSPSIPEFGRIVRCAARWSVEEQTRTIKKNEAAKTDGL